MSDDGYNSLRLSGFSIQRLCLAFLYRRHREINKLHIDTSNFAVTAVTETFKEKLYAPEAIHVTVTIMGLFDGSLLFGRYKYS